LPEDPAEAFVESDRTRAGLPERHRDDVVEASVVPFVEVMLDVVTHDSSKGEGVRNFV
jgi:hypothetical protein